MACLNAAGALSSVVMSLNRIPFLGKSGTSRMSVPRASMGVLAYRSVERQGADLEIWVWARKVRRGLVPPVSEASTSTGCLEAESQPGIEAGIGGGGVVGRSQQDTARRCAARRCGDQAPVVAFD